jgi:HAD superfamily hydrolase (TIGR01509 family)
MNENVQDHPDWSQISYVLLDMDGTLLDDTFDQYFWLQLLPQVLAEKTGCSFESAQKNILQYSKEISAALSWYCVEHWSRVTGIDIIALKQKVSYKVKPRLDALEFLQWLKIHQKPVHIITDAHPETIRVKLAEVDLSVHVDQIVSSHSLGLPKKEPHFWKLLQQKLHYVPARTLFIDDSYQVLSAAHASDIAFLFQTTTPTNMNDPLSSKWSRLGYYKELITPRKP